MILDITPNFPRNYKYGIGNKMQDMAVNLLQEIAAAYNNRARILRIRHLVNFQSEFGALKTLLRKAGERKWILGRSKHAEIIEILDNIGRQATAWKNSLTKNTDDSEVMPELESYD